VRGFDQLDEEFAALRYDLYSIRENVDSLYAHSKLSATRKVAACRYVPDVPGILEFMEDSIASAAQ
jgi:hypothetical protein